MRVARFASFALVPLACHALAAHAGAQGTVPVRPLGHIVATTTAEFGPDVTVRPMSDGRILVNDRNHLRLLLVDSSLAHPVSVADSTTGPRQAYGARATSLFPYLHDSSLFVDPTALGLIIIDPNGKMIRTVSLPRAADATALAVVLTSGYVDPLGRFVYEGRTQFGPAPTFVGSTPIVRLNMDTRQVDTLTLLRDVGSSPVKITSDGPHQQTVRSTRNPVELVDNWALLSDGSVAVIRGQDYHIDWIPLDGSQEATPKIPYSWHRLTEDDKVRLLDSVRKAFAANPATSGTTTSATGMQTTRIYDVVSRDALPDYLPPFRAEAARADMEGNVWIQAASLDSLRDGGGTIYDVVDPTGRLVDRVQIPGGCTLIGFGPGVAFLTSREGTGTALARARVR